jgi:hypothetical protein
VVLAGLISAQVARNHAQARKRETIPPFSTETNVSYLEK